jgi:ribosomal protein S13
MNIKRLMDIGAYRWKHRHRAACRARTTHEDDARTPGVPEDDVGGK